MEEYLRRFFKEHGKNILVGLSIGVLTYFMMMSLNLVNDLDGLWHLSNFIAGDWEISLGRGLQRYADRARFGIVSDPFNSILTLLLLSTANAVLLKRFPVGGWLRRIVLLMLLTANPVVCESLSYSYMSVNFGSAYLFSVLSFAVIREFKSWKQILTRGSISGLFLGISMAFYQAYLCVASILIVITLLRILCDETDLKKAFRYALSGGYSFLCGGVIYYAITQALLFRAGISLASYRGAASITPLLMVQQLPHSVKNCYLDFFAHYWEKKAFSDLEFIDVVLLGLSAFYLAAVLIRFIELFKRNKGSAFLFIVLVLLLPAACCSVLLVAAGNRTSGLMSMGLVLCPVLLGAIVPDKGRLGFYMKRLQFLLLAAFAWFQLSATVNDQLALKEGKTATVTLTENILYQLSEKGYLDPSQPVALVGRPADNDLFAQNAAYQMANGYAKFGCWSTDARNNRVSWAGVVYNFLGIELNLCNDSDYRELVSLEQVADMPEYPAKGSICMIQDIVVVKVSDVY